MANDDTFVPLDTDLDLNTFLNKYKDDNISTESQPNLFNIKSPHYDLENLNCKVTKLPSGKDGTFHYTTLHLNIQSLPAKIDNPKLIISELYEKKTLKLILFS